MAESRDIELVNEEPSRNYISACTQMSQIHFPGLITTLVAALLFGCTLSSAPEQSLPEDDGMVKWIGAWMTAQGAAELPGYSDQSFRMIAHPHFFGQRVRIRFANHYGAAGRSIVLTDVNIAARQGKTAGIVVDTQRLLTFDGNNSATLASGEEILSDPVSFPLEAFKDVSISFHVAGTTGPASSHTEAHQTSYLTPKGAGNHALDASGEAFADEKPSWYYLNSIEVVSSSESTAVVILGDSITDGSSPASGPGSDSLRDTNGRWPDVLARRVIERGLPISILNAGIGGNRLLNDAALDYAPISTGASALNRLDRDVLNQPGVITVIVLEGINDIGIPLLSDPPSLPVTADQMIDGYRDIIRRAHARGLCAIGATLTPTNFALHGEPLRTGVRHAVNEWIRNSPEWDGVIDFDAVVRDPEHPDQLLPEFDSGDGLHPSPAGYDAMGKAIDLSILKCRVSLS